MNLPIRYLFLIVFFFNSCKSSELKDSSQPISQKSLKEDFTVFRKTLEEAHPGLYWYTDKKEMDALFDSVSGKIDGPMTDEGFFNLLLPAVARIRCVHTRMRLSENTQRKLFSKAKLLPLNIAIVQDKVFVIQNFDSLLPNGFELTAINDVPSQVILKKMLEIIPSDGFNMSHKFHDLKIGFREAYALLYGQPDTFHIAGKDSSQRLIQFSMASRSPDRLMPLPLTDSMPIKHEFLSDGKVALLSIRTFQLSSSSLTDRMDAFFSEMENKKIDKLIIDVRDNGGGNNANVTRLFSYLALRPFLHLKKTEMKTRELTFHNNIRNYNLFSGMQAIKADDGTYQVDYNYPGRNLTQPVTNHAFSKSLIVLSNGGTVSAASEFVALVRGYSRGIVIGEEAGGCYYGATGGNYLDLVLPNSGIRVTVPTVKILLGVPEDLEKQPKGRGAIPEYEIRPTVADLINHRDPELSAALKILSS